MYSDYTCAELDFFLLSWWVPYYTLSRIFFWKDIRAGFLIFTFVVKITQHEFPHILYYLEEEDMVNNVVFHFFLDSYYI